MGQLLNELIAYCDDVQLGIIPSCVFVEQACERFRRDLNRQGSVDFPYEFRESEAKRAVAAVEMFPHIKGPLAGQKISLELWQKFIIANPYGWYEPKTGARRFKKAYNEVPRGNGKTAMAAPICLYALALDGEGGAEVVSAATTRDQAKLSWKTARAMVRKSPEFASAFGVVPLAHSIEHPASNSEFIALSTEGQHQDGLNLHFSLIDEHHAHKNREMTDVIVTGSGKRPRSIVFIITTAGSDMASVCYEYHEHAVKVLSGAVVDESFFAIIFTVDEKDKENWMDPSTWEKANPNLGVSVDIEQLKSTCTMAMASPSSQNAFKTKHLNIWVNTGGAWMDMVRFEKCKRGELKLEDFEGRECFLIVDLATKIDLAVKALLFFLTAQ